MKGPLAAALLVLWLATSARAAIPVAADFSRGLDYPLTKDKFGLFNSGLVKPEHYERDIPLYDQIKPNSLRVDLWWGGGPWSPQPVSGTPNNIHYHFEQMDRIAQLLNKHRVQPCWAYCYIPPPLQPRPGDWRSVGADPKVWGEVLGNFAKHARDRGGEYRIGYHEIYNEPDNRDFFRGTRDDYFALYREGSRAIRAADPDALIGGPALAFTPEWVTPFLEMVRTEALPLDFFSYHFYPKCWGTNTIRDVTAQMRGFLAQYPDRATTEMHLNEYNSFPIDYPRLGTQDRHTLAAALLEDYEWFLSRPDLAQICWAQFQDTGGGNWSGMIRRVYRIDSKHSSWGDDPETEGLEPVETREKISTTKLQWAGVLSKGGVLYLEVENARRQPANPGLRGARLVRELHYYPDRNSPGYAYLDKAECTARLGMASDAKSHQQVGILIENLPPKLKVQVATEGQLRQLDQNSLLGLRFDYAVGTNYSRSVLFHGPCSGQPDLYDPARTARMPWGTGRQADRVVRIRDMKTFPVAPGQYAPQDWSGRVQLTCILQNAGQGARARMSLTAD